MSREEEEDNISKISKGFSANKTNIDTVNGSQKALFNQSEQKPYENQVDEEEEEDEKIADDDQDMSSQHIGDVPDFRQGSVVAGAYGNKSRPKSSYVSNQYSKDLKSQSPNMQNALFKDQSESKISHYGTKIDEEDEDEEAKSVQKGLFKKKTQVAGVKMGLAETSQSTQGPQRQ